METDSKSKRLKVEPLLGGLALILLLMGCFSVLRPFMTALLWATILAYSLYPMQRMFTRWFRGSRTMAACFVTLTLSVILAGPIFLIGFSIAQDGKDLANATRKWFLEAPDQAPAWVAQTPVVGKELSVYWSNFAEDRKRWVEQLDQAVKSPPPRPKIVVENGDGFVVQEAPAPVVVDDATARPAGVVTTSRWRHRCICQALVRPVCAAHRKAVDHRQQRRCWWHARCRRRGQGSA
jgi:hypothetical protein